MLGGRCRARRPTSAPPACTLPSQGAEGTSTPLLDQLKDPSAPFLPPSLFFFCTESRRAGAGNSSSLVSEPILFPVLCQNLFCFPTQGVGARPHPAARGTSDVVCLFCHSDEVFLATIAQQSTNVTDLSPSFQNNGRGSTAPSSRVSNGGVSGHRSRGPLCWASPGWRSPDTFCCPRWAPRGCSCALTPPAMAAISPWLLAGDQAGRGGCQPPPKGLLPASRVVGAAGRAHRASIPWLLPKKLAFALSILLSPAPLL